ncbi:hypothetical protein F2P81_017690 [Scophthalmus maximus]|uniref:EGF-like domain-containing protein n=1 Tax=Scophthalmus maximus TaxID=52904 RepID=A0A6A4SEL3_SCOMX|nr:hypothetical protein F2P81_017690 [Scophthalmus maximus]
MFTPTICKVRCDQDRCVNYCERGNVTTLYSSNREGGRGGGRREDSHGPGFRVFLCPLLCKNGGICLQKDRCLCSPNFTGKFCQIPVTSPEAAAPAAAASPSSTNEIFKPGLVSAANQDELTRSEFLLPLGQNQEAARSGAQSVISEEKGQCHRVLGSGRGPSSCSLPILRNITKQICCCSRVGKAWGPDCQRCPYFGSDIDECVEPSQCPGQMCVNSVGSYRCVSCRPGYTLTNRQCADVNECEDSESCPGQVCVNTEGSYSCVDCEPGYHSVKGVCRVDVSFGLILLRPEMKTKERSAAQKMQNRVVSLSPSAAEMGDHQRVLRRESPPPSPQETASTSESSTTRDDQSAPESETEAEVEAVKEAPAPAPAPAPSPPPAPAPGLECDASDHSFLQIPELELNRLLQEKEARIDRIVGENCDLLRQAERLRRLISDVVEDKAGLTVELSSVTKAELNSDLKVRDQETAVHAERQKTSEAESRLVGETEQVSRLAAALTRARDDLEESGRRREWDTSRLRAEGAEETSGLAAALLCVREDERRERLRWQSELFALRESLDAAKRLLEASQEETAKCTEELMERIRSLETTMEEMKSEAEEKKTTTASLWRRFLQLIA